LAVRYADYAVWQREAGRAELLAEQLAYWKEKLAGAPELSEFPLDRPRPHTMGKHWGRPYNFLIPDALLEQLKMFSQTRRVTLFMTLLAAFQVLLSRLSGQRDIIVGSPIAGRTCAEIEELIGFFVNTLVLRTDLSGNPTFNELLERVKENCLGAYSHQELSFERLVGELNPERNRSYNPLFQILFQFQNIPLKPLSLSDLVVRPLGIEGGMMNLDLAFVLKEGAGGLRATMRYNTELFEEATIQRMAKQYEKLLGSIVVESEQRIGELELMDERELRQVVFEWNQTAQAWGGGELVHEVFEEQATREPWRVAVKDLEEEVSYGQLNERANRLANYLASRGVGVEARVGLCVERSVRLMVGVLGILKAGAAYVPLPCEHPRQRLEKMIADSGMKVVVSESKWREKLSATGVEIIWLDELDEDEAQWGRLEAAERRGAVNAQHRGGCAQNLAYVIYTSGSTGEPKGVMIQHASLMNHTRSAQKAYQIGAGDRVLQFASLSFDTSGEEIYPALVTGATLVLRREGLVETPREFLQGCEADGVTVLDLPTAYWHEVAAEMERGEAEMPKCVRLVIVGGEKLERWALGKRRGAMRPRLINSYGPTEATIVATRYEVREEERGREVAIGRAIENVQVYVLDEQLRAVPIGVWGELYIGGAGVGRGYWGRAELTAERFVPHPYSEAGGERLYRTGDVCRYRGDGELEYGGRLDQQVKLRGQRIELGEVEAALSEQAGVRASVVRTMADARGEHRLVAYVVLETGAALTATELRQRVGERLPGYMIPAAIVFLDHFPVTSSFKIDYRALPLPEQTQHADERTLTLPRTPLEQELAAIWRELLNVDQLSVHDNFFVLGGHSLMLTRLASRIRKNFQIEIPLQALFVAPTITEMASTIAVRQLACKSASDAR
jgi:amino acid adenylation domain-containing protein